MAAHYIKEAESCQQSLERKKTSQEQEKSDTMKPYTRSPATVAYGLLTTFA